MKLLIMHLQTAQLLAYALHLENVANTIKAIVVQMEDLEKESRGW